MAGTPKEDGPTDNYLLLFSNNWQHRPLKKVYRLDKHPKEIEELVQIIIHLESAGKSQTIKMDNKQTLFHNQK